MYLEGIRYEDTKIQIFWLGRVQQQISTGFLIGRGISVAEQLSPSPNTLCFLEMYFSFAECLSTSLDAVLLLYIDLKPNYYVFIFISS